MSGRAAWYCQNGSGCPAGYSGGLYAAAGPALRVGDWRGRTVSVCGAGNCVNVTLVDWCACGGSRVIDLFSDAYPPGGTAVQRDRGRSRRLVAG